MELAIRPQVLARRIQSMEPIIDINRYQSISINRLILIIDDQSMAKIRVLIDWYRLSIPIDKLIGIDWLQISGTGIDTQKTQFRGKQ